MALEIEKRKILVEEVALKSKGLNNLLWVIVCVVVITAAFAMFILWNNIPLQFVLLA